MDFYISSSVNGASGYLSIIGRNGGDPIRPGDEFHSIYRLAPRPYPIAIEEPREVEVCRDIRIKVAQVESGGKALAFLPANFTGILRCSEFSEELVPGGWILSDRCPVDPRSSEKQAI